MKIPATVALAAGAVLLSVGTAGAAYAVFSHGVATSQTVEAGTVVVDSAGPDRAALRYVDLVPGEPRTDHLPLRYSGTVTADLFLDIEPDEGTPFCRRATDGGWEPVPGGAVEIRGPEGGWVDYCSLLEDDRSLTLQEGVAPGTDLDLGIDARLRPGTDYRYSGLDDSDRLAVHAREGASAAGFSDRLVGSIEIGTAAIPPLIPQHCIDAGLTDFDADNTIYLTEGDDVYETGKQPRGGRGFLVFGFDGNDHIVGSNQGDCIDGGSGDDELWGANQSDVVIGGDGDDVIYGGNAKDSLTGDSLFGENGDDRLYGGRGTDVWDGGGQVTGDVCIDTSGGGNERLDRFQGCESVLQEPEDHPVLN